MKIPKKVTIMGRDFKVSVTSRKEIAKETEAGLADGAMSYKKKRILISDDLDEEEKFITFFHECNHAIDYISGFSQILTSNEFELSAESRGVGFYDVFKSIIKYNKGA